MSRGGKREGAGRKPGALDKFKKEQAAAIAASGLTPLDYMLGLLRDEGADSAVRFEAAKAAAPYCHARLSNVQQELSGPDGGPLNHSLIVEFVKPK